MKLSDLKVKQLLLIIVFAAAVYFGIMNIGIVAEKAMDFIGIFAPVITGLCIAFLVNIPLKAIEKMWDKGIKTQKGKRAVSLVLSYLIVFGIVFSVVFILIPKIGATVAEFLKLLPQNAAKFEEWWHGISEFFTKFAVNLPEFKINTDETVKAIVSGISKNGYVFIDKTVGITTSIFSGIFDTVLAFVFSVYVLAQKEKIGEKIKSIIGAYCGNIKGTYLLEVAALANRNFTNFVTGQLTEAVILGTLCFFGMLIFRMPYASLISVLVGVTALVPIFGALIGTAVGAFLILLVSPVKALWFVVFVIVLQQLEGNIIYPRVVGKSVGLPGILVLLAVTVGSGTMGVVGMLISVPLLSVIYTLFMKETQRRIKNKL